MQVGFLFLVEELCIRRGRRISSARIARRIPIGTTGSRARERTLWNSSCMISAWFRTSTSSHFWIRLFLVLACKYKSTRFSSSCRRPSAFFMYSVTLLPARNCSDSAL